MNSHLSDDIARTATHHWRRFGGTVLLSGLALLAVLLITQPGEAQTKNKDRVHTAIVTCGCTDPGQEACEPLVLDSSFTPAPAVETACDPETLGTTCAKCLGAVASQIGGDRIPLRVGHTMLPNELLIYTLITGAGPGGGPHVIE